MISERVAVSAVIPCYNEEENVRAIHTAVTAELQARVPSWEIIFIDNGSSDRTRSIMRELCQEFATTRAIFNTKNFGQMRSPTYAIYQGSGEVVFALSADFQDPPELFGTLYDHYLAGSDIVLGQPRKVKVGFIHGLISKLGYWFFSRYADVEVIPRVTGFGLTSRRVVDTLARWNEPEPFFRGMLVETGYPITVVPFDKPARRAGKTNNSFATLLDFSLATLRACGKRLLRLPLMIAVVGLPLAALALLTCLAAWLTFDSRIASIGALLSLLTVMWLTLLAFIGLLGEQVRGIVERTRNVPLVLELERVNFDYGESRRPS